MMKAWSRYSQTVNDPVRHLNVHFTFQNGHSANVSVQFSKLALFNFSFIR